MQANLGSIQKIEELQAILKYEISKLEKNGIEVSIKNIMMECSNKEPNEAIDILTKKLIQYRSVNEELEKNANISRVQQQHFSPLQQNPPLSAVTTVPKPFNQEAETEANKNKFDENEKEINSLIDSIRNCYLLKGDQEGLRSINNLKSIKWDPTKQKTILYQQRIRIENLTSEHNKVLPEVQHRPVQNVQED